MTEDEKKVIEDLRKTIDYYNKRFIENNKITSVLIDKFDINNLFILLNLVEKQQKALENSVPKEAIREKIKEISEYEEIAENQIEEKIIFADSDNLNFGRKQAHGKDIEVLKELLEE